MKTPRNQTSASKVLVLDTKTPPEDLRDPEGIRAVLANSIKWVLSGQQY